VNFYRLFLCTTFNCLMSGKGQARVEVLQLRLAGTAGVVAGAIESKEDLSDDEVEERNAASTSKGATKKQSGLTKREEKNNKPKDDLSKILSEVTGRSDIGDDSDEEDKMVDLLPSSTKVRFLIL